jgi:uncharacterized protein (TIGR03435 family)
MIGRACVFGLLSCGLAAGQVSGTPQQVPATQTAAAARPIKFEVSSVRRNKAGTYGGHGPTADGYDQKGMPAVFFVGMAYGVLEFQKIQGLPDWCLYGGEVYDINAKVAEADIPEWRKFDHRQIQAALQELLADRFHLKTHFETRDAPVYALVVAKNGPKFKPAVPGDTYPDGIHTASGKTALGLGERWEPGSDRGRIIGQAATMANLAQDFSTLMNPAIGHTVVDRTGLTGQYDFSMPVFTEWMGNHQGTDSEASIFTAIEESLGLRLEPAKAPMEFLVVDHIERPTDN